LGGKEARKQKADPRWTLAACILASSLSFVDGSVLNVALPAIRVGYHAGAAEVQWVVNAYLLPLSALLLLGGALGDHFGRRRLLVLGTLLFGIASLVCALAPSLAILLGARGVQGIGAAIVAPLTLTLLSEAFPGNGRGLALGVWSGVSGLGVALGPLVGGAVVEGISWQWIFWLNVPVGLVLAPLAMRRLAESHGTARSVDLPGLAIGSAGLLALVTGIIEGNARGWGSPAILTLLGTGLALLAAFFAWERRAPEPMLPPRFFSSRGFSATNAVSLAMYFGIFGSIFLLAQFFQTVQGMGPLEAGLRTLPWTGMPMLVAPIAGLLSDRIGSRPLMASGLALQAVAIVWLAAVTGVSTPYAELIVPFVLAGTGMALVFAPAANAVLRSVRPDEAGQASGATNTIRELGGVLGIAVLAAVFTARGGYTSPQAFVDGLVPALYLGAGVLAAGALAALAVPGVRRERRAVGAMDPLHRRSAAEVNA
jgi:EmrB/QacA subfamily drug resistance transporter